MPAKRYGWQGGETLQGLVDHEAVTQIVLHRFGRHACAGKAIPVAKDFRVAYQQIYQCLLVLNAGKLNREIDKTVSDSVLDVTEFEPGSPAAKEVTEVVDELIANNLLKGQK